MNHNVSMLNSDMQHAGIQEAVRRQLPYPSVEQQHRGERKIAENDQRHARRRELQDQQ